MLTEASKSSSEFLFGNLSKFFLIDKVTAPGPDGQLAPQAGYPIQALFAFQVLPLIVFIMPALFIVLAASPVLRIIDALSNMAAGFKH